MDEERRKEYWATLALRHCPGLGVRSQLRLLSTFGTAFNAFEAYKQWDKLGINERIIHEMNRESWRTRALDEWKKVAKLSARFVLWSDEFYPKQLRNLPDAPILIYLRGDISLFKSPGIALIGSRISSPHGLEVAAYLAKSLSACGIVVISGMANGIDSNAHKFALQEVGKSIGVLGTGIDIQYPSSNKYLFQQMAQEGLLLSEFAPGTPPYANNFPIRNRIISGLSIGVVVVEAARKSGSLITAKYALEQNRDVFAVPGPAMDKHCVGCQDLVRQGARAVFSVDDILKDLSETLKAYNLSPIQKNMEFNQNNSKNSHIESQDESEKLNVCTPEIKRKTEQNVLNLKCDSSAENKTNADNSIIDELISDIESRKVVDLLRDKDSLDINLVSEKLEIDIEDLNCMILGLEMLGIVIRLPGGRIKLNHGY